MQNSDDAVGDIFVVDGLFCTICYHDLDHVAYDIRSHPRFPAPLCLLCHDTVESALRDNEEDKDDDGFDNYCSWCVDDDGSLFCCDTCKHAFCKDCLRCNLGASYVALVEQTDNWRCLMCENAQLDKFKQALKHGYSQSIYTSTEYDAIEGDAEVDAETTQDIHRFRVVAHESSETEKFLDAEHLCQKEWEIREEFSKALANATDSVSQKAKEELDRYILYWQHHLDLMQRQEADLFESINYQGIDVKSVLPQYDAAQQASSMSMQDKLAVEKATRALDQRANLAESASSSSSGAATDKRKQIEWTEAIVEEEINSELMAEYATAAATDDTVQEYVDVDFWPDLEEGKYPSSFEKRLPVAVLKALYYVPSRSKTMEAMVEQYNIPRHICIVMMHATKPFPHSTNAWSMATTTHPSVRAALYHSENRLDLAVLCDRYQLDGDMRTVTDCGKAKEVYRVLSDRKKQTKETKKAQFTLKDIMESTEHEAQEYERLLPTPP
jgi:hypothetical protein